MSIKIQKFVFSPFQVNTYLVYDTETKEGIVIDPGCSNFAEETQIANEIESLNVNLLYVVNTHLHIDHIFGNTFLINKFNAKLIYPLGDEFLLPIMKDEAVKYNLKLNDTPRADIFLEDIDFIEFGNVKLKNIFTPGHTPAEYCFYCAKENILFSGDVLFKESIGRTDLWQGDYDTLIDSIYDKLFTLPENTIVYPGHGAYTTIAHEKSFNPFL